MKKEQTKINNQSTTINSVGLERVQTVVTGYRDVHGPETATSRAVQKISERHWGKTPTNIDISKSKEENAVLPTSDAGG